VSGIVNIWQDPRFLPAVSDCCSVDFSPRLLCEAHCLEQIDVIDLTRGDALIVSIDCSMNEASAVMRFEASNDALIHRLDMGSQVGFV
jgi:hypothetical protein